MNARAHGWLLLCLLVCLGTLASADEKSEHEMGGSGRSLNKKEDFCAVYRARFTAASTPAPAKKMDGPAHCRMAAVLDESPRRRAELDSAFGKVHAPISCNADAQAFFDQGMAQFHGFFWYEAERSFREAWTRDPDCPIAVWGMAIAAGGDIWTPATTPRARELAAKARDLLATRERAGHPVSALEKTWIEAYADVTADNAPASRKVYLERLRKAAAGGETEARALLVFALLKNDDLFKAKGATFLDAPNAEYLAETDGLIDAILKADPNHPAHHYRIHLWDYVDTKKAEPSLESTGASGPATAHLWHMPGHVYFKTHRYAEALWHQEASARVDHAYFEKLGLMPFLNATYVHNNGWLAETMLRVGRGRDAVRVAQSLIDLPRHPRYSGPETNAARLGWDRMLDALEWNEDWTAVAELDRPPTLYQPARAIEEVKWQRLRGVAAYYRADRKVLADAQARLKCLAGLVGKTEGPVVAQDETELAALLALLDGDKAKAASGLASLQKTVSPPPPYYDSRLGLSRARLSSYFAQGGDWPQALTLAREAEREAPGQVTPLAHLIETLVASGEEKEARERYAELGKLARFADRDLPIFQRLEKALGALPRVVAGLDWQEPRKHPALEKMGPLLYTPTRAPVFTLTDADGKKRESQEFFAKPTLLVFNLGGACVHCNEQLTSILQSERLHESGIQTVVIAPDSPEQLAKTRLQAASGTRLTFLSDPNEKVFSAYGARDEFEKKPLHAAVLVGCDGRILWRDRGSEPFQAWDAFFVDEAKRLTTRCQVPPK